MKMTKLLCALGLILLSCGVAEAADSTAICFKGVTVLANAPQTMREVPCDRSHDLLVDVSKATIAQHSTCYYKMKEAMWLADKYKGDLWSSFKMTAYSYNGYYPSTERCVTSACLQKELDEAKAKENQEEEREKAREKWRAVYKECVQ